MLRPLGLLALALAGCASPSPQPTATSSSIVLSRDEARLYVTSPDDDAVVTVDAASGAELSRAALGGAPEQLAWAGEDLLVTLGARGAVARLNPATNEARFIEVPCGSTRAVVVRDAQVFVSCPDDDRVVTLDLDAPSAPRVLEIEGGPSGLALFGDTLGIALGRIGALARMDLSTGALEIMGLEASPGIAASQADALTADSIAGFVLAYQRVEHDGDRDRDPRRGGYGSVIDGTPRIEPRLRSACGDRYARFDGGALAQSGPSALAIAGGLVWITHLYTDGVVLLRCGASGDARSAPLDVLTTFAVGRGPRGIALSVDGRTAFVDNGFAWSVSRLDAPSTPSARLDPTWTRTRPRGPTALSDAALRGRSLFFDAVDTHLTPSGVVTCGTCHPRAGEDGLSWFLHTEGVPRKLRRTPPAWGARAALAPYHWDGAFTDAVVLSRATTEELMEGDGLLVDFGAIAAYLEEAPLPAPRPVDDAAAVARGRDRFIESGCETCHAGPLLADGLLHDVLPPSADPDANVGAVSTPSLVGIRARAPYFHDGRASRLIDTLDLHGTAPAGAGRADLVTYLESL